MSLTDMKRSKKERKSEEAALSSDAPAIPYGLRISLDDESLKKLGFKNLPAVGDRMVIAAIGTVDSVSEHDSTRRKNRDVSIELDKLDVSPVPPRKVKTAEGAVSEAIKDV